MLSEIAGRLAKLRPPIVLDQYIGKVIKVGATTLDGINFVPKNVKDPKLGPGVKVGITKGNTSDLLQALKNARAPDGGQAFVGKQIDNREHWALKLSFGATKGIGFRGPWRFPELSAPPLQTRFGLSDRSAEDSRLRFGAHFGASPMLPDLSSLHFAVHETECNVHIDQAGFVLQAQDGNVSLTPDFFQHLVDELLFKTNLRDVSPGWAKGLFNRISLIYPSSANHFSRMGPRLRQVPLLRNVKEIPGLGPVLSRVPLPGVSISLKSTKRYKLKVNASCAVNGSCSAAITFGGNFE